MKPKSRQWQLRILPSATFQAGHQVCTKAVQTPHPSGPWGTLTHATPRARITGSLGPQRKFHRNFLSSPLPHLNL